MHRPHRISHRELAPNALVRPAGKAPYSLVSKKHNHEDTKQSNAKSVTVYLDEVPPERKAALGRLRDLCRTSLKGFKESMRYGGPCYSRDGEVEVDFASQKNFIGLYILRTDVMNARRDLLKVKGVSLGKGCILYSKPEKIDFKVVKLILKATCEPTRVICG